MYRMFMPYVQGFLGFILLILGVFFIAVIAGMLYQKWYGGDQKGTFSFTRIYFSLAFFGLSLLLVVIGGKFGDDLIDKNFDRQLYAIDQAMDRESFDINPYHCAYLLGIRNSGDKEPVLDDTQVEECKEKQKEQRELSEKREELWKMKGEYKNMYMLGFVAFLWLVHGIGYGVMRRKKK